MLGVPGLAHWISYAYQKYTIILYYYSIFTNICSAYIVGHSLHFKNVCSPGKPVHLFNPHKPSKINTSESFHKNKSETPLRHTLRQIS